MVNEKNKAAVLTSVQKIEIKDVDMPVLKPGEVLIKPEYVGVCGSDVHFFETGKRKGKDIKLPFILGHECAGVITEVSEGIEDLKVGDRVAIEPQRTCGKCEYCKSGRYNLCLEVAFPSVPPYDGFLRKYVSFPAHLCYKLPENVSSLEGALIEPLAIGLQAARCGNVDIGKTVAIIGMGCIGLMVLLSCKAMGASKIIAIDLYEKRLQYAEEFGATEIVNSSETDMIEKVNELTNGKGADIVFETAGSPVTASATVSLLKRGGAIVIVGNVNGKTPYDFMELMYKEGDIRTMYRYKNNFAAAINAVSSGAIKVKNIASDIFTFEDTQKAFEKALNDKKNVMKAMIRIE